MATPAHKARPTIGILADLLHSPTEALMLPGAVNTLTSRGANALLIIGRALDLPLTSQSPANQLFDAINSGNVDGLIALSGSLANFGPERVRELLEMYQGLPVVSAWLAIEGFPSITIDNQTGMYAVISHLIEAHGARRIAFIKGPEGHTEAVERFDTYRRALADHGIPFDPALVAEGTFVKPSGVSAIKTLLDERRVTFDALASANDEMLSGAIEVLRERGIRVPGDLPAVGFDDIALAGSFNPPLTTVHQPFYEMGQRAAETVLAMLAGEDVPGETKLPAELVVRRSCGCALPSVERIVPVAPATPAGVDFGTLRANWPADLRREMRRAIDPVVDAGLPSGWPADLLDALAEGIDGVSEPFLTRLEGCLDASIAHHGGMLGWQDVITLVRGALLPSLDDPIRAERLEVLLHRARTLVSMALMQAQTVSTESWYNHSYYLNLCTNSLVSALDIPTQMDVLAEYLPYFGIQTGCVVLYDEPSIHAPTSQVVLAFDRGRRIDLAARETRFPTARLLPEGYLSDSEPYVLTVQPLHFLDEHLGLLFMQVVWETSSLYELLRTLISASIKSALLYQDLQRHSQGLEQAVVRATAELRRAKEQAETILNNSPDITLLLSPEGIVERANPACKRLLGFTPLDLIGQSPAVLLAEDSRPALRAALDAVTEADEPIRLELIAGHRHGLAVDVAVVLAPVREHGELTGIVCGMHNITQLKEVERMKDAFLATAAHELRTPLTTIRGFSELLLTRELSVARRTRYLSLIEQQSVQLGELIDNLLDVAKIQAGRGLIGQVELVDVQDLIRRITGPFMESSPHHVFWFEGLDNLPPVVGDPLRLAQVIRNLVSNAVKYSPDGGAVTISARAANGTLHIAVRDEGVGLTREQAEHVFDRFYRVDQTNSAVEGTGLGLTISRAIAQEHGGDIEVKSEPGAGSTFTLNLPCRTVAHQMVG
jgi:sigma-B regulation protein RsbU (phosphoserine phosphatase)